MKNRSARLSVGAGGLVLLWIVTYWWMDSDPTIRFDRESSSGGGLAAMSDVVIQQPPDLSNDFESGPTTTSLAVAPPSVVAQDEPSTPPADEPPAADPRPVGETLFYTIQRGDLLSRIAQREYGSIRYTAFLYEHNRERLDLSSPDAIREGQELEIPPIEEANASVGGGV